MLNKQINIQIKKEKIKYDTNNNGLKKQKQLLADVV